MRYSNSTLRQYHLALFAPLAWLERLEEQQHHGADQYAPMAPLPAPLHATLIGLNTALIGLQQALRFEQAQLSPLFENAGKTSLLKSIKTYKQCISVQTQKLLDTLTLIQSLADRNGSPRDLHRPIERFIEECRDETAVLIPELSEQLDPHRPIEECRDETAMLIPELSEHQDSHRPIEDCWDETAVLIPQLSEQLIRYLHLAETCYLPLADHLLGPATTRAHSSITAQPQAAAGVLATPSQFQATQSSHHERPGFRRA